MKCLLTYLSILLAAIGYGQINKYGNSLYENYDALTYNAAVQNWTIVQDQRGVMYFGNNDKGVLEYDGKEWRKIPAKNGSIIWALEADDNGTVFVGAVDEFGYLFPDEHGDMKYNSLALDLDSADKEFGNIYRIYCREGKVYFCSVKRIFEYDYKTVKKYIDLPKYSFQSYFFDNKLYVGNYADGLTELGNQDTFVVSKGGEFFYRKNIFSMNHYGENKILIGTIYNGMFLYDPATGEISDSVFPRSTQQFLKQYGYYSIKYIAQKEQYIIGSLDKGSIITDKRGNILVEYNTANGLQDDRIFYTYIAPEVTLSKPIWYALDKGISKQYYNSPITYFGEVDGLKGGVIDIIRYKGVLYIATVYGVYYLSYENDKPVFHLIEEIYEPWKLYVFNLKNGESKLLVGTISGIYEIYNVNQTNIVEERIVNIDPPEMRYYIYTMFQSTKDPDILHLGTSNGLLTLKYDLENEKWKILHNIEEVSATVRSITMDKQDNIWVGTGFDGVRKIKMTEEDYTMKSYKEEQGLPSKNTNKIYNFDEKLLVATEKGIYRFNYQTNQFYFDKEFGKAGLDSNKTVSFVNMDIHGNYWLSVSKVDPNINETWMEVITPVNQDEYKVIDEPFKFLPNLTVEVIYNDVNDITWIGNSSGLYCYNENEKRDYSEKFNTLIRSVILNDDSLIFNGTYYLMNDDSNIVVGLEQPVGLIPEIDFKYRNLKFTFAAPYFDEEEAIKFSVYLEGYDNDWSKWGTKSEAVYTNLDEGDYVFKVKAMNLYGTESEIASYAFSIEPPWYRTIIAYIIYVIVGGFVLWLIIALYTRKLKRDKIRLEKIVAERTAEVEKQKEDIEKQRDKIAEINEELTDSIQYAKRIQKAILPHEEFADSVLEDHFILFKPKDIVSGDFYWLTKIEHYTIITAADCTGHGVPGAFMSMLGVAFLNEIVKNKNVQSTGQVLDHLRDHIIKSLQQTGKSGEQKDGMDIALCAIDSRNNSLQFSGANNPLYIIRNKTYGDELVVKSGDNKQVLEPAIDMDNHNLFEVKGDKMPVAIHLIMDNFQSFEIDLMKGDTIYMFSDGFADQFGGKKGKKFMYKPFKKLLLGMQDAPMSEQKATLDKAIEEWKAFPNPYTGEAFEQIDDIVVVGLRIV